MTKSAQTTAHILMIRPANFGYNEQTASDNAFQQNSDLYSPEEIKNRAIDEFDHFVDQLRQVGITVNVINDSDVPVKPDAVFPNNWITFHQNGRVITYPMNAPLRRAERREEIIDHLSGTYDITDRQHLEQHELNDVYLEGTGSMVLDRTNRIAYACISPRTDELVLDQFCELNAYQKCLFTATDRQGVQIYHTNVMMALGESFVIICMDTVRKAEEQAALLESFSSTDKEVIRIREAQMQAFAGNMLQLRNQEGETFLVMSTQAYQSLDADQIAQIESHTRILHSSIDIIETYGGGSARCMIAEIFLPSKSS